MSYVQFHDEGSELRREGGLWSDGLLITGQQQYAGGMVAELVIEGLGR